MQRKFRVGVFGSGNIGSSISLLLTSSEEYEVFLIDKDPRPIELDTKIKFFKLNVIDDEKVDAFFSECNLHLIISALPFYLSCKLAKKAKKHNLHYLDLTEDINESREIQALSKDTKKIFSSQCGLAPGFIQIASSYLIKKFDNADSLKIKVGALPQFPNNLLKYSVTWSIDGLVNQYLNKCEEIIDGKLSITDPLDDLENFKLDRDDFESFNTSGGLGYLSNSLIGKINKAKYQTIRYPGYCYGMNLLLKNVKTEQDLDFIKSLILELSPSTMDDVVIIYIVVEGYKNGILAKEFFYKRIYPQTIDDSLLSAIQISTASGVCAIADLILTNEIKKPGFLKQEDVSFENFMKNRFAKCYA
jgi:saccharopine dehydrogenase-like NADP-dependent oxidoreductase